MQKCNQLAQVFQFRIKILSAKMNPKMSANLHLRSAECRECLKNQHESFSLGFFKRRDASCFEV